MLNIYTVNRTDGIDYDEYDAFVCIAKNKKNARNMFPYKEGKFDDDFSAWINKKDVNTLIVNKIGVSDKKRESVILASFNAG